MKVARRSFLGVLLVLLLLATFLVLHAQAASQVSPKTSIDKPSPATSVHEKVINADGGVYWRAEPDWLTPIPIVQHGVYTGDTVDLACYTHGGKVPPYNNNPLWYWAEVVAGHGLGSGWINDHFLNTGTNQPNIPVNGVDPCPQDPYIWSHTSDGANLRSLPEDSFPYSYIGNGTPLNIDCWIDGGWMTGDYRSNIWFHFQDMFTGPSGYIHASLIANLHTIPKCHSLVTLARGPLVSNGIYRYAITLSGFPADTSVSVECYDSVSPSGFSPFTMTTDGMGNSFEQNKCFSGDGPDHWVVAGGLTSNHVQWGGGSPTPQLPTATPTQTPIPSPMPTPSPTSSPSQPVDAYSNYGPANTGYPICRGNPNNSQSWPGGTVSQTFTVPVGVASLNSALVQIDPDPTVTAHMSLAVNGNVVATTTATASGDTQFWFGPVSVSAGDMITLSISFTATYGKITTVYTAGSPGGTFTTSDSCPDGASNVHLTNTGLRARVSGMS